MIFGGLGDMGKLMQQAKAMQGNLKRIKDELKHARYETESNGIKVVVDGELDIKELKISGHQDIGKIGDAVKNVVNKALKQARDDAANKLKSATGGLSLPGM